MLECSHTFNYSAIFNAVKENKKASRFPKLRTYQIKCPYCRNVQDKLLPYYKTLLNEKIYGVNHPEEFSMNKNLCSYRLKSGKRNGQLCEKKCYFTKCNTHLKFNQCPLLFNNNIDYKNLKSYTVAMLRTIAKVNKCKNYSKLKKNDLITTIVNKYNEQSKKE